MRISDPELRQSWTRNGRRRATKDDNLAPNHNLQETRQKCPARRHRLNVTGQTECYSHIDTELQ